MEWIIYILLAIIAFTSGYFTGKLNIKDDGILILNEEKVEVIFRDSYENLINKKYVKLKRR